MIILKKLYLDKFRGIESCEVGFHSEFNLLVGVNGVGKSSIIDALSIMLSYIIPELSNSNQAPRNFIENDITFNWPYLNAKIIVEIEVNAKPYIFEGSFKLNKAKTQKLEPSQESNLEIKEKQTSEEQVTSGKFELKLLSDNVQTEKSIIDAYKRQSRKPLAIYYSPYRGFFNTKLAIDGRSKKDNALAYINALNIREFNLSKAAELWEKEEKISNEKNIPTKANLTIKNVLQKFLDGIEDIYLKKKENEPRLYIKKHGVHLDINQLSEGERNIFSLVVDLSRRLALISPDLNLPNEEAGAIVLIDELDLHLHPKWQSKIVEQLRLAFPKCQFIATSHSPQIISTVKPESIILIERQEDSKITIKKASQSYGLDSSAVLRYIMDVPSRPKDSQELIDKAEEFLEEGELDQAREVLEKLKILINGYDYETMRIEASINNLEALADEMD